VVAGTGEGDVVPEQRYLVGKAVGLEVFVFLKSQRNWELSCGHLFFTYAVDPRIYHL